MQGTMTDLRVWIGNAIALAILISGGLTGQTTLWPFPPKFDHELIFAHFGNGSGVFSQILLFSPEQKGETQAKVFLVDDEGHPMTVQLNQDIVTGELDILVPTSGVRRIQTTGSGSITQGWVRIVSDRPLAGFVLFGGDFGLAGVGHSEVFEYGFLTPIEEDNELETNTGIAVANLEEEPANLELRLYDAAGVLVDTAQLEIPASGHLARLLQELDWSSATHLARFEGTLKVRSSTRIAATTLQVRPGQYATLPVAPLPAGQWEPEPETICEGSWTGSVDHHQNTKITFRVSDQSTIDLVRVSFTGCSGQLEQATAVSGTIRPDRSFSIPLNGPDVIGLVRGTFSADGQSVELSHPDGKPSGVALLARCFGGNFSWRAQPDRRCE